MKERIRHLILFIILIVIDQGSKFWVRTQLVDNGPIVIFPGILKLQYQTNTGAVWGIFSGKVDFLKLFTLLVTIIIVFFYLKIPKDKKYNILKIIVIFILAGAVGNMIDRFVFGYVTDFIYFELINFPLFNFADSCLTVSCILLFLLAIFYYKDNDFAFFDHILRGKKAEDGGTSADITAADSAKDMASADKSLVDTSSSVSDPADKSLTATSSLDAGSGDSEEKSEE